DAEDNGGLFSGYDPKSSSYDNASWAYAGPAQEAKEDASAHSGHGMEGTSPAKHGPARDETLQHPRSVFQILKRHYARYTPEMVERVCATPPSLFLQVAELLTQNSGRERTSAICYAVGWTQQSYGAQIIRAAGILQLLLGNIGRPGGGIMALRGHASIQGSTDIPTLYNILPGYLPMPHTEHYGGLEGYIAATSSPGGWWGKMDTYITSLLKAWWGAAATEENGFCFEYLPRIDDDNSSYWTVQQMLQGKVKGYIVVGENPAVGSANGKANRLALSKLDWLVVRDLVEIETASFWYDSPEIESGELRTEEIPTEVFFLPAASHVEKDGSFTNTQRLLQWHFKAVEPKHDCRSDLWFYYHLGRKIRERLKGSEEKRDRPVLDLTWHYPTSGEIEEPSAEAVIAEVSGHDDTGQYLSGYKLLRADGTTRCGCWIYCGV